MAGYVLDTSVFVGLEHDRLREIPADRPMATTVVTLAELQLGVLHARDVATRAQRLATLQAVRELTCLAIDERVAEHWATLVAHARAAGRRPKVNDTWIAAIALANDAVVLTQDADFEDLPIEVVRL